MKEFFQTEIQSLGAIREFPWHDQKAYADFLAQTYYYVCHTTRLLAVCAARIGIEREKLHHRFLKHAAEERSHHLLAERDVEALGTSLSALPERALTSALYESQYFRAEHISPTMIFGYIFTLEGLAAIHGPYVYESVKRHHGDRAAAFVKLHAHEDPGHLESSFAVIEGMSDVEISLIQQNFCFTRDVYLGLLREIQSSR